MCFLPEPLHKWYIIYAYVIVSFSAFVLFKRECCIFVTELSVELRRIEISFQPYLLQLTQLLDYSFREFQGVPAEVNQWQQFLHMREVLLYLILILIELGAFFLMFPFHCFNMPYQFFILTFKYGYVLLQFLSFRFQLIAAQKGAYLCHECRFRLGLGGFQLFRFDFFPYFVKLPLHTLHGRIYAGNA